MDTAVDTNGRNDRTIERVLGSLPLFADLPLASLARLATLSSKQAMRRGSTICTQGDAMPGVLTLAYGSAMLALRRPEGGRRTVRFLAARECFGLAAALHGRHCPLDMIALTDCLVVTVPAPPLLRLLGAEPAFARSLVRQLSENYLDLLGELESSVRQNAVQRLATYLASLAEPNGSPQTWIARLPVSKTAIAERLGITKETMSRLLRELSAQGAIQVERRDITILDRNRLAAAGR
jgi:CRP-like cAMP-binding protein